MNEIKWGTKGFLCRNSESTTLSIFVDFLHEQFMDSLQLPRRLLIKVLYILSIEILKTRNAAWWAKKPGSTGGWQRSYPCIQASLKIFKADNFETINDHLYNPCLNAAEHLIGAIKWKVKAILFQGK